MLDLTGSDYLNSKTFTKTKIEVPSSFPPSRANLGHLILAREIFARVDFLCNLSVFVFYFGLEKNSQKTPLSFCWENWTPLRNIQLAFFWHISTLGFGRVVILPEFGGVFSNKEYIFLDQS